MYQECIIGASLSEPHMISQTEMMSVGSFVCTYVHIPYIRVNWTRKFLEIMEECVPQQELKRRRNLPWLTKNVVRHMRKRNNMFLRAKRSKNPTHLLNQKRCHYNASICKRKLFQLTNICKYLKLVNKQQETIPVLSHAGQYLSLTKRNPTC